MITTQQEQYNRWAKFREDRKEERGCSVAGRGHKSLPRDHDS